jgi:hypothetical protein
MFLPNWASSDVQVAVLRESGVKAATHGTKENEQTIEMCALLQHNTNVKIAVTITTES